MKGSMKMMEELTTEEKRYIVIALEQFTAEDPFIYHNDKLMVKISELETSIWKKLELPKQESKA